MNDNTGGACTSSTLKHPPGVDERSLDFARLLDISELRAFGDDTSKWPRNIYETLLGLPSIADRENSRLHSPSSPPTSESSGDEDEASKRRARGVEVREASRRRTANPRQGVVNGGDDEGESEAFMTPNSELGHSSFEDDDDDDDDDDDVNESGNRNKEGRLKERTRRPRRAAGDDAKLKESENEDDDGDGGDANDDEGDEDEMLKGLENDDDDEDDEDDDDHAPPDDDDPDSDDDVDDDDDDDDGIMRTPSSKATTSSARRRPRAMTTNVVQNSAPRRSSRRPPAGNSDNENDRDAHQVDDDVAAARQRTPPRGGVPSTAARRSRSSKSVLLSAPPKQQPTATADRRRKSVVDVISTTGKRIGTGGTARGAGSVSGMDRGIAHDMLKRTGGGGKGGSVVYLRDDEVYANGLPKTVKAAANCEAQLSFPYRASVTRKRVIRMHLGPQKHAKEKADRFRELSSRFHRWKLMMLSGFNLLLFGFGSKRQILDAFAEEALRDGACAVVTGFDKNVQLKEILSSFLEAAFGVEVPTTATIDTIIQEMRNTVESRLAEQKARDAVANSGASSAPLSRQYGLSVPLVRPCYFAIHSIDALPLRQHQKVFATLATIPTVHIVASADNTRFPALWDPSEHADLNFIYEPCMTFQDYRTEVLSLNGWRCPPWLTSGKDHALDEDSEIWMKLMTVMRTLTSNHRELLVQIALLLVDSSQSVAVDPVMVAATARLHAVERMVPFNDVLKASRRAMIAQDKTRLGALLTELTSHRVVFMQRQRGTDYLMMPFNRSVLTRLVAEMEP